MTLSCTVVHSPGSVPESLWDRMRHEAHGGHAHEVRIVFEGAANPSGATIDQALSAWIHETGTREPRVSSTSTAAGDPVWVAVLDGLPLTAHAADSPSIRPGMVVTLHPLSRGPNPQRSGAPPTRVCISSGPDSGWMTVVPRGAYLLGRGTRRRGTADVRINDPELARAHASLLVGAKHLRLVGSDAASTLMSAGTPVTVGRSRLELTDGPPSPSTPTTWPTPAEPVTETPPGGRHRTLLVMSLAPLVVGVALVIVTGMWIFLLFSAASAIVAAVTVIDARRRRRRFRRAVRDAAVAWAARRNNALPSPGRAIRLLRARLQPQNPMVEGDEAAVVVSVGTARLDAELDCDGEPEVPRDLRERTVLTATGVPLHGSEHTMIAGPPREQLSVMRWMLAQLAHHFRGTPEVLIVDGGEHDGEGMMSDLVDPRQLRDHCMVSTVRPGELPAALRAAPPSSSAVPAPVLLSPTPLLDRHVLTALDVGWHVISPRQSPMGGDPPRISRVNRSGRADGWDLDLASGEIRQVVAGVASGVGTGLTPDGMSRRTLHEHLRLGLIHTSRFPAEASVPAQFTSALPSPLMTSDARLHLKTLLGRGAGGDELLDLVDDGPHILIAGTTGAGKSELLKSMLLGWAARYGPGELNFLLFDFKGGSSFQHIAQLEHTLGLVTDLSQAQADRTLEGVRSELTRRERLFLNVGATDYADFRGADPRRRLARLLVVVDEFRIFTQQLPDVLDELMRLATLGRSLGLHLILATQRPQGAVTADIRANIGTTVCLRLRSDEEARELVGTTAPAQIPRQRPGRAVLQRPGERPTTFQSVQLVDASSKLRVRAERSTPTTPVGAREPTADLVATLHGHVRTHRIRRPHTPLCPPLPEVLRATVGSDRVMLGLIDDPSRQMQHRLDLDVETGQCLALMGEAESGGAEVLQSLVSQLLGRSEAVHVYLLDGDHTLERFRRHPRVGSWITTDHPEETHHLLGQLHTVVTRRRTAADPEDTPLVMVVSGHSRWNSLGNTGGGGAWEHDLGALIAEGSGCGFSAVLSGGRELALGRLGSRIPRKVYLPYGVPEDTRHLWPKLRVTDLLPGRGVLLGPDDPSPGLSVQLVGDAELGPGGLGLQTDDSRGQSGRATLQVHPLPETADFPIGDPPGASLSLGIAQFTHANIRLEDDRWQLGLILGTAKTGKTNALRVIAAQRRCWTLQDLLEQDGSELGRTEVPQLLVIDDADRCGTDEHRSIEAWLSSGRKVLATAAPSIGIFSQLPWAHRARGGSANFLLSPLSRSQGDAFGITVPVLPRLTPGRALWFGTEGTRVIQWWRL